MSATINYDWGQEVLVVTTAPINTTAHINTRPGPAGSVCGMRELEGKRLYLVEFSDGEAIEIAEDLI